MTDDPRRTLLTPKLIDSLYVEAMVLADEARSYFDDQAEADRAAMHPNLRVHFACESLRVTTRLMHVIAWLLSQRAVAAGEISSDEGRRPDRRLGDAPGSDERRVESFPEQARALIRASEELYGRVGRLDRLSGEPNPSYSPARTLMSRLERSF